MANFKHTLENTKIDSFRAILSKCLIFIESNVLPAERSIDEIKFPSLFQTILAIFFRETLENVRIIQSLSQANLLMATIFANCTVKISRSISLPIQEEPVHYSTLIVTENADLHSAVELLTRIWENHYEPWTIRDILVQETVKDKFFTLLKDRFEKTNYALNHDKFTSSLAAQNLESFEKHQYKTLYGRFVLGIQRNYVQDHFICAPIVTLNIFRTSKEAVSLYNKINGGSAIIYSEAISEAFELAKNIKAKNIWINSDAVFMKESFLTFGSKTYGLQPLTSVFSQNYLFSCIAEPNSVKKSIVVKFGQTFAN